MSKIPGKVKLFKEEGRNQTQPSLYKRPSMHQKRDIDPADLWLPYSFRPSNMISLATVYHVLEATVPLYAAMMLAYLSIKWWKLFTPDQCTGINKFVAKFSVPLLSFHVISTNNPYQMNLKLLFSDSMQKMLALLFFAVISKACFRGSLDWLITGFSLSTLPNTLIVGIPLLKGLYGDEAAKLLGQIIVLQSLVWYTLLLFLFEFRVAKAVAANQNDNTGKNLNQVSNIIIFWAFLFWEINNKRTARNPNE